MMGVKTYIDTVHGLESQREGFFRENRAGPASGLISRARGTRNPTPGCRCWGGLADPAAAASTGVQVVQ